MFKIVQTQTYTWPVNIEFPADGGRTEKAQFDIEFKRLNQTRLNEIRDAIEKGTITDLDLAREVIVSWKGITDESGEVPYSETAREQLLEVPRVATAVVVALFESLSGAKRKN